jgi:hypothetical protein
MCSLVAYSCVSPQPYLQEGIYEFTESGLLRKMSGTTYMYTTRMFFQTKFCDERKHAEKTCMERLLFVYEYALRYKRCGNVLQKLPTGVLKQCVSTGVPWHIGVTRRVCRCAVAHWCDVRARKFEERSKGSYRVIERKQNCPVNVISSVKFFIRGSLIKKKWQYLSLNELTVCVDSFSALFGVPWVEKRLRNSVMLLHSLSFNCTGQQNCAVLPETGVYLHTYSSSSPNKLVVEELLKKV